jgi:hypothetical protein
MFWKAWMLATLDREVILGIGIDDVEQVFARAKAETPLQHLKACQGMKDRGSGDGQQAMMALNGRMS